jgi:signal peptidase I
VFIVNLFIKGGITDFYQPVVYGITLSGLLLGVIITIVLSKEKETELFYHFVDAISIIWTFFLVFYLLISFIMFPARVNGTSMTPNFDDNNVIIVWKLKDNFDTGDVVFVNVTTERTRHGEDDFFLKRIIGTPGDVVEFRDNVLYINGSIVEEDYIEAETTDFIFDDICFIKNTSCSGFIPSEYYFVLGDNRNNSVDSRYIGLIHKDDLFGKVIFDVMRFKVW